ncbi:NUDIX domain-containing protein [Halomonas binhaiensis]|uniref:ADP-ribose pyrophosphatase n=1 Tax=Halomonas binhaiensis TaxID=2562282 RepID=A0A5C1ND79_9GAMM|nr:NUDIX domain-containing protein [Halomonas binhaiensis]QEM80931.1 NUDIX domain-containing protein [Halomonas binhaiensis]
MAKPAGIDAPFSPDDVDIIARDCLYQGFFRLEKVTLKHRLFEGGWSREFSREVHRRHDAVGVMLYDPEKDAVVLVEQIRAGALDDPLSPWKLECVAGLVDKEESPEEVARREALEEAGCEIRDLIFLHSYYPSPGACDERVSLYCGMVDSSELGGVHGLDEENEDIRVHVLPFQLAWELLGDGRLDNAMCLIGFHWLAANRASLRACR